MAMLEISSSSFSGFTETRKHFNNPYLHLCSLADTAIQLERFDAEYFACLKQLTLASASARFTAGLQVLINLLEEESGHVLYLDKYLVDQYIAELDGMIQTQLDHIIHHPQFQKLEATWSSIKYLIDRTDFRANIKIELLNISKEQLIQDLQTHELLQTGLYHHVCGSELNSFLNEPFTLLLADYTFDTDQAEIAVLKKIADIAAFVQCPFLGALAERCVTTKQFTVKSNPVWEQIRAYPNAYYLGLTFPKFVLRLPYGDSNPVRVFNYQEADNNHLWGRANFAVAANMIRSFRRNGWLVNIQGFDTGGKVIDLPMKKQNENSLSTVSLATDIKCTSKAAMKLAKEGITGLCHDEEQHFVGFMAVTSIYKSEVNSLETQWPYLFILTRLVHYLKVFQRELIGLKAKPVQLEQRLNSWLQGLVIKNDTHGFAATQFLRSAKLIIKSNSQAYQVQLLIMPWFADVKLAIKFVLPKA